MYRRVGSDAALHQRHALLLQHLASVTISPKLKEPMRDARCRAAGSQAGTQVAGYLVAMG